MKKSIPALITLVFIFLLPVTANAQFFSWHWSITEGGELNEYITAVDTDNDGNIYVTGSFQGTLDFFGEPLESNGGNDVFTACFDPNGSMKWVVDGGGEYEDIGKDICVNDQFVYVTGGFQEQASFEDQILISDGARDMFLLKYDHNGILQWAERGGSVTDDIGNSVAVDVVGNIYLTGDINYMATFGDKIVQHFGFTDLFIAKYSNNGDCVWAKSAGGAIYDYGGFIESINGHVFVAGAFNDVAYFDTASITSVDIVDVFIAHYLSDGSFVEIVSAGGANNENIGCMSVDEEMNVYIGGWYMLDISIGEQNFTTNGGMDIFVAKFEPATGFVWANSYGGTGIDEAQGMSIGIIESSALNSNSSIILTGTYENTIAFGNTELTSEGFDDGFIVQLDLDGNIEWVHDIGGAGTLNVNDCVHDESGNCCFVGDFVDELRIGYSTYVPVGGYDLFIAKLDGLTGTHESFDIDQANRLTILPNPVRSKTTINYYLGVGSEVSIYLYDQHGRIVRQIMNKYQPAGDSSIDFDAENLTQGVHLVVIKTNKFTHSGKLVKIN